VTDEAAEPGTRAAILAACRAWLAAREPGVERLDPMPGDVSARRYFRAHRGRQTLVVAFYPPALRDACRRWLATDRLLSQAGVRTPTVLDADCATGFMLLEDLGVETLQDHASSGWAALEPWLRTAVDVADRIRSLDGDRVAALLPPLGAALLEAELEQTWTLYLEPHGLTGDPATAAALRAGLARLVAELAASPPEPCHRDFMARNLVPLPAGAVAVLDHQDLRPGPPFYDLASLTNDTLYPPARRTEELLGDRLERPGARPAFHRAAAQRALKIVGTFESFRRRGTSRHVGLIRPSLEAALRHLAQLPETVDLVPHLRRSWSDGEALC
jgi:hypothetical protein